MSLAEPTDLRGGESRGKRRADPWRRVLPPRRSSLTRKIVIFNLLALNVLVAGILYLNSARDSLALQRVNGLMAEVELIADVFEAQLPAVGPADPGDPGMPDVAATLAGLDLSPGVEVHVFDPTGRQTGHVAVPPLAGPARPTALLDALSRLRNGLWPTAAPEDTPGVAARARALVAPTLAAGPQVSSGEVADDTVLTVASPVLQGERPVAVVVLASAAGEIDRLLASERESVLKMFVIATLVSVGLSLILASTIARPLAELAAAAEIGGEGASKGTQGPARQIRIPDLSPRADEIGRLSEALRGMVSALYHRIESNEQFAADVAHEIKNPLASLRSAVGTLRVARRDDQRERLLEVIEHDVRRLDRLVSDISNASRLDSDLVKEEQAPFDLIVMIDRLGQYLGEEARQKGIEVITDFPSDPVRITGLEDRLAQVFVNLIANAVSFCEEGDAIRLWARKRENRVVIVVEDTGPGIPNEALTKIFHRFYSERREADFGNNSGLGLAISKQIVEAHGGVIWAENIRPTDADITSDPLGARFVVGLPV